MQTAKVFISGNSQAVRLPKNCRFSGKEVEIIKRGEEIILREIPQNLVKAFELLTQLSDDFFQDDIADENPQERDFF